MSSPPTYKSYLGQSYEQIKAECLKSNKLFVDDKFPADNLGLCKFIDLSAKNVVWRRPLEILKGKPVYTPVFVKDKIRTSDIRQAVSLCVVFFFLYFLILIL